MPRQVRSGLTAWLTLLVLLALLALEARPVAAQSLKSIAYSAHPSQPGPILFSRLSGSNFHTDSLAELYAMNSDGTSVQRLTTNKAHDAYPVWSPDGQHIGFVSDRGNPHLRGKRMTRADGSLGPQLGMDVYVVRQDGSHPKRVTRDTAPDFIGPQAWGHGGTTLLITSWADGDAEIVLMRLNGTVVSRLTDNEALDTDAGWSPDGERIVFRSDRSGQGAVYIMRAHGSNVVQVTPPGERGSASVLVTGREAPLYAARVDSTTDIAIINADGSGRRLLTNDPASDIWPTWSPDGGQVLFQSDRDGNAEVYVVDADGSNLRRLTRNPTGDVSPSWGHWAATASH